MVDRPERQGTSLTGRSVQLPFDLCDHQRLGDITSSIVPRCAQPLRRDLDRAGSVLAAC